MKRFLLISALYIFQSTIGLCQEKKPVFLGLQPSITQEKFYDDDEFDINILPVTVEFPVSKRADLRFTSILNYHIGGEEEGISDVSFQMLAPIFFIKKEIVNEKSYGFYIAPVGGYGRNLLNDHHTYLLAVEPGYLFKTEKSFTLSLGIQFGGSYFDFDDGQDGWEQHFGVKVNLGFWL
jgi:hypothetical protein